MWDGSITETNVSNKAISVARHGLNKFVRMKELSQVRDRVIDVVVLDHGVWPNGIHQLVFANQSTGVLDEHTKCVEQLATDSEFLTIMKQSPLTHIKHV
jgi:hypothetical protein